MVLCSATVGPRPAKLESDKDVFQIKDGKTTYWSHGEFVRQCGSMETLTAVGGLYKNLTTVQAIWLKSKQSIEIEHVHEALKTLTRQVSLLQFCIGKRSYKLWFRRMKQLVIDFEASNEDAMQVYQEMVSSTFDMWNGPLWRARLVFTNANDQCSDQTGYTAVLIFAVHHCLTDGTTNMMLCRETVRILNDIAKGAQIVPESIPLPPIIDDMKLQPLSFSYAAKFALKKVSSTLLKNYSKKSSFNGSFPLPKIKEAGTRILFDSLTVDETKNLIKQCKGNAVTVHACIVTASNFALLKAAQTHSKSTLGKFSIKVSHCVNVRRYLDDQYKDAAGCHVSIMENKTKMCLAEHKSFWEYSKQAHASFKTMLEVDHEPVKLVPLLQFASLIMPTNDYLTNKGYKNKTDCHYLTTNMGNLKTMLPEGSPDDVVEIVDIMRSVSMQYMSNPFLLTFHTFRNSFKISMDYYTNKMTDEVAKEYFETMCQFIRNLAAHGTIYE